MVVHDTRSLLTTSDVGEVLQVHPSTVKRWSDEGSLQAEKTSGGHRRFRVSAVLEAAREKGMPTFLDIFHPWEANAWLAITEAARNLDFRRLHSLALNWLHQGETDLLGRLLHSVGARAEIPFEQFLDHGVRGFMSRVGEEWRDGRLQVGEEHMATHVVSEALLRLRPGWDMPGVPTDPNGGPPRVAVVGAMEGDLHDLGALSVRILLEREGWRVYYLGANVPLEEFAAIQRGQVASLVCISFSPENTLPDLQRAIRVLTEFHRPRYPYSLALGGGFPDLSKGKLPEGPFQELSLFRSAGEFLAWIRTRSNRSESQN